MAEKFVTKETFELAKLKGFDVKTCRCGGFPECICDFDAKLPTQAVVHTWLRDEKRLHVEVRPGKSKDDTVSWHSQVFTLRRFNMTFQSFEYITMFYFAEEYEDAMEKGLVAALNLLKDKDNGSTEL